MKRLFLLLASSLLATGCARSDRSPLPGDSVAADGAVSLATPRLTTNATAPVAHEPLSALESRLFPAELVIEHQAAIALLPAQQEAISKELAPHNVTINAVLPGMHHTPGIEEVLAPRAAANGRSYDEEVAAFVKAVRLPAGRFGDAEDLGAMVAMFCSAQASYVTGQSLVVDGGIGTSTF